MPRARANMSARPESRRLRWRALGVAVVAVVLIGGGTLTGSAPAAFAVTGQIRGHVFLDFDGDGIFDSGNTANSGVANDTPSAGTTVRAYNRYNTLVGTATSAATGNPNYIITLAGVTDGDPLRIEYTLPTGSFDSFAGTNSRTSVRFVQAGAENVDLGIVRPDDTNAGNPYVSTVLQRPGLLTSGPNTTAPSNAAVVLTRWSQDSNVPTTWGEDPNCSNNNAYCLAFTDRIVAATIPQVGSVYWTAYDGASRVLYVAANYRRGSALGPGGLGAIYRIQLTFNAAGAVTATTLLTSVDMTAAPRSINLGGANILANASRSLGSANVPDPNGFSQTLKVGIGGMAIDSDRRILYFVNLFDKRLYAINVDTGARVSPATGWATTASAGTNQRAFGLLLRDGQLYIGYNDTGENRPFCPAASPGPNYTGTGAAGSCGGTPTAAALRAYVDRATIGTGGTPGAWTTAVLSASLGYTKGSQLYDWGGAPVANRIAGDMPQIARWNTWTDHWSGLNNTATNPAPTARSVSFSANTSGGSWNMATSDVQLYPQPFLSSLSIDAAGYLTLGLGDRTALQSGSRQVASSVTNLTSTTIATWETIASGDTLLAAPNGTGGFTLESNGTAGTRTMSTGRTPTPYNNQGPGGAEFYYDRQALGSGANHMEASLGSTVIAPGVSQVASTFIDPQSPVRVTGLAWFSSGDGAVVRGYQQENDAGGSVRSSSFQKGGGIGGLALMLNDAPVEIGNRVWYDADLDGIQDSDEPAIGGAVVELWSDTDNDGAPNALLATATTTGTAQGTTVYGSTTFTYTNTDPGSYYFRSADAATGGVTGFTKNANYVVVFRKPTNTATSVNLVWPTSTVPSGFSGLTWAQVQLTTATAAGSSTVNDSNPNATNGRAPVTVGGGSENDHTIDGGWYGMSTYRLEKAVVGTPTAGATFTLAVATATNFRGDDRRWVSGAASNPIVDTLSYALNAGQTVTTTEQVPYGYVLTFTESNMPGAAVAFTPPLAVGNDDTGRLVIAPSSEVGGVKVTATNSFTTMTVSKVLSPDATLPAGTTFPVEYTVNGGPTITVQVAAGTPVTLPGIPWGSAVRLRENLTGPFSWGGYIWTTGTWAQGPTALVPDSNGWVTVTASSSATPLALTLTNHPYLPPVLPFTGGLGADLFTIAGGLVLVMALGLGVWQFRIRRTIRRAPVHRV